MPTSLVQRACLSHTSKYVETEPVVCMGTVNGAGRRCGLHRNRCYSVWGGRAIEQSMPGLLANRTRPQHNTTRHKPIRSQPLSRCSTVTRPPERSFSKPSRRRRRPLSAPELSTLSQRWRWHRASHTPSSRWPRPPTKTKTEGRARMLHFIHVNGSIAGSKLMEHVADSRRLGCAPRHPENE